MFTSLPEITVEELATLLTAEGDRPFIYPQMRISPHATLRSPLQLMPNRDRSFSGFVLMLRSLSYVAFQKLICSFIVPVR
ncbi:MAG: hypothetical protein DCF22_22425 [Leptolyngbya sp.]|nr:MAG: hypothetical protein DCF22_22425 [Leptolyngbya sp.]